MLVLALCCSILVWSGPVTSMVTPNSEVPSPCRGDQFECKTGGFHHDCIPSNQLCDQHSDCNDGSDEDPEMCKDHHELTECTNEQFECPTNKRCIPVTFLCDGDKDCEDNADERNCPEKKCANDKFECESIDKCIARAFVCDGTDDCGDLSDELHCECTDQHSFHCANGKSCPPVEKVCNHKVDCPDGSDEGGRCFEEKCALQCGTYGRCYKTPNGPRCNCQAGFKDEGDICQDVDECADMLTCDQSCYNTPGNYSCSCKSGYEFQPPETCRASDSTSAMLFYTFHTEVRVKDLDTNEDLLVHAGDVMTVAVAYDPVEGKVYWSDHTNKIYRKSLRSEDLELLVSKDVGIVYSLAIDWVARNLYIADNSSNSIVVCSVVHKACSVLNLKTQNPTFLDLDITRKQLFWVEASNKRIMKANLDGSRAQPIVDQNLTWPNALTFDAASRRLYWMDAKHKKVGCFDVDRNIPQEIPGIEVNHPSSSAVWEDKIYWNDWGDDHLYSALKKDGKNKTAILRLKGNGIKIYHPQMMNDASSSSQFPCDCSHICLPSPVSPPHYYKCACPAEMQLSHNARNCIERDDLSYLILGAKDKLYSTTLRKFRPPLTKPFQGRTSLVQVSDIDYDPIDETLFIADKGSGKIIKVELAHGDTVTVVQHLKQVMGIAADWSRRNIYWVDAIEGSLEVATTLGKYRRRLNLGTSCSGLSVAISITKGRVVIACESPRGKILSCTRSGAPCLVLVKEQVRSPLSVSIDQWSSEDYVYWTDSSYRTINAVALDGSSRKKMQSMIFSYGAVLRSSGRIFASRVGDYTSLFFRTNLTDEQSEETLLIEGMTARQGHRNHWALAEVVKSPEHRRVSTYESFCRSTEPYCQQLCLQDDNGKVCACSSNEELSNDGYSCRPKACSAGQHTCAIDGICISERFRCNGVKDCADASDEAVALCYPCIDSSFKCVASGKCIDQSKKCDGQFDCSDHSDELNCTKPDCLAGFTKCSNGDCYLEVLACDGKNDCSDASDEEDCQCDGAHFRCANGNGPCQPVKLRCDGRVDCLDRSDEANCQSASCGEGYFKCSENTAACIPEEKVCDSVMDCSGGEDELPHVCVEQRTACQSTQENCRAESCTDEQFQCISTKQCIDLDLVCDGESHCDDASDENICQEIRTSEEDSNAAACLREEFDCGSGECISALNVCDDVQHCSNGADEGLLCVESCTFKNGGCEHACHSGARASRCSCRRGYRLLQDQRSCQDVDECSEDDPCEQLCTNTPGSFRCSCVSGYTPVKNSFCRPIDGRQARVGLLNKNLVSWLGGASRTPVAVAGPHTNITHASYDGVEDEIVAVEDNGVVGRIDKSTLRWTPILSGFNGVTAMDVDSMGRNVYISFTIQTPNQQTAVLKACSMRTGICYTIYKEEDVQVSSIAVAQRQRTVYFCINGINSKVSKIYSSPLDGNGKIEIVHKEIRSCSSLALDEPKELIYWIDPDLKQVKYATFTGHKTAVYKHFQRPIANLEVSGPTVQWLLANGSLQYCQKWSSRSCSVVHVDFPATAMVVSSGAVEKECQFCKAANCKNLCVAVGSTAECLCDNIKTIGCSVAVPARPTLSSGCSPDPCAPGGICVLDDEDSPTCNCHEGYEGDTCYITKTLPKPGHPYVGPLIAVIVLLIIGVVGIALYFNYKKPFLLFGRKPRWTSRSKTQVRFSNPAYGAPAAEIDATLRGSPSGPSYETAKSEKSDLQSDLVTVRMN